jgi:hypothetical protein
MSMVSGVETGAFISITGGWQVHYGPIRSARPDNAQSPPAASRNHRRRAAVGLASEVCQLELRQRVAVNVEGRSTASTMSSFSIEDFAKATTRPFWFQLHVMRDRDFIKRLIARVGRAFNFGLGAMGEEGVRLALEIIRKELDTSMASFGVRSIADIRRDLVLNRYRSASRGWLNPHLQEQWSVRCARCANALRERGYKGERTLAEAGTEAVSPPTNALPNGREAACGTSGRAGQRQGAQRASARTDGLPTLTCCILLPRSREAVARFVPFQRRKRAAAR